MTELADIVTMRITPTGVERVRQLEAQLVELPQLDMDTQHLIHGGQYARTILLPKGVIITGAQIKLATTVILSGHCTVTIGDGESLELYGYHVIPASAGRKQAYIAHEDTYLTMIFASQAKTVEQAEEEFTDEAHLLVSRHSGTNSITITGE